VMLLIAHPGGQSPQLFGEAQPARRFHRAEERAGGLSNTKTASPGCNATGSTAGTQPNMLHANEKSARPRTHALIRGPVMCFSKARRAAPNQPHKLVPLVVRQPHGVVILADVDTSVGNLDLRAMLALFA